MDSEGLSRPAASSMWLYFWRACGSVADMKAFLLILSPSERESAGVDVAVFFMCLRG